MPRDYRVAFAVMTPDPPAFLGVSRNQPDATITGHIQGFGSAAHCLWPHAFRERLADGTAAEVGVGRRGAQVVVIFAVTVIGGVGLLGLAVGRTARRRRVRLCVCYAMPLPAARVLVRVAGYPGYGTRPQASARRPRGAGPVVGHGDVGHDRHAVAARPATRIVRPLRRELRRLVDTVPPDEFRVKELSQQVGPYRVDRFGADQRGGVYFRTYTGADGIGPDETSYGFALSHGHGTPFGNAYLPAPAPIRRLVRFLGVERL